MLDGKSGGCTPNPDVDFLPVVGVWGRIRYAGSVLNVKICLSKSNLNYPKIYDKPRKAYLSTGI